MVREQVGKLPREPGGNSPKCCTQMSMLTAYPVPCDLARIYLARVVARVITTNQLKQKHMATAKAKKPAATLNLAANKKHGGEAPIKGAFVRYDKDKKQWAAHQNPDTAPFCHFDTAVMENVEFKPQTTTERVYAGCGVYKDGQVTIGFAIGDLYRNSHGGRALGGKNMGFDGVNFFDAETKEVLAEASAIRLMSDRRAVYYA